jgi:hypothetical protein
MNPFDEFRSLINKIFILIILITIFLFLFSCKTNASMYNIYLEHQPNEPLYSTSSLEDAKEYYRYFKPFHSDMYITTIEENNNLVILKYD